MKPRVLPTFAVHLIAAVLVIFTGAVIGLAPGDALAEATMALQVTARVVAPCTISLSSPQSSCSDPVLAQQMNVMNSSARISSLGTEVRVTHRGRLTPVIERREDQVSVNFR